MMPATLNVAASITKPVVLPRVATMIPPIAAPMIMAALLMKLVSAFAFCNASSLQIAGITPDCAGQKIPHIKPKLILATRKTQTGTWPVAKNAHCI